MLYLFGRLALSDSLDYHENFQDDDFLPAAHHERGSGTEPEARSTALDRQPRPCPQPVPAGAAC
jgi:hypothetical protein